VTAKENDKAVQKKKRAGQDHGNPPGHRMPPALMKKGELTWKTTAWKKGEVQLPRRKNRHPKKTASFSPTKLLRRVWGKREKRYLRV